MDQYLKNSLLKTGRHISSKEIFCVNFSRCKKREYFENLDFDLVSDNKMFWNSEKCKNITLTKGRIAITGYGKCAERLIKS